MNVSQIMGRAILESLIEEKCTRDEAKKIREKLEGLTGRDEQLYTAELIYELHKDEMPEFVKKASLEMIEEIKDELKTDKRLNELKEKTQKKELSQDDREELFELFKKTIEGQDRLKKKKESWELARKEFEENEREKKENSEPEQKDTNQENDTSETGHFTKIQTNNAEYFEYVNAKMDNIELKNKDEKQAMIESVNFLVTEMKKITLRLEPLMIFMLKFGIKDSDLFDELEAIKKIVTKNRGKDYFSFKAIDEKRIYE